MSLVQNSDDFTVIEVLTGGRKMLLAQCNKDFNKQSGHRITLNGATIRWTGPYVLLIDGKQFN